MKKNLILLGSIIFTFTFLQHAKCDNIQDYLNSSTMAVRAEPLAPVGLSSVSGCGNAVVTATTTESDVTMYWQGTNPDGYSTATVFNGSQTVTAMGTSTTYYYVRALRNGYCCDWSDAYRVSVIINEIPQLTLTATSTEICANGLLNTTTLKAGGGECTSWTWTPSTLPTTQEVTTSFNTTTTVKVTGSWANNSCTATKEITILVNRPETPVITATSGTLNQAMCKGTSQILQASNIGSYGIEWIIGNEVVGTQNTYTIDNISADIALKVQYTDATNSCISDVKDLPIKVSEITANFTSEPSTVAVGGVVTFTNTSLGATSWTWTIGSDVDNSNITTKSVYFYNAGKQTIQLTASNANGCSDTKTDYVTVGAASIQSLQNSGISVYPNPLKDILNIDLAGRNANVNINVYSMMGSVVLTRQIQNVSGIEQIDLSELPSDVYIVSLTINGNSYMTKLTKE